MYNSKKYWNMKKALGIILLLCIQQLYSQNELLLSSKLNRDNSIDINYKKTMPGNYFVYLNFKQYDNTYPPKTKFVADSYNGFLFGLTPIDKNRGITYSYSYMYYRGILNAKIEPEFVYLLPFKDNTSFEASFLYNIDARYFNKQEPKNWKSFQFTCNKTDTICSARKGVVIDVVDIYSIDTTKSYSYSSQRNYIIIEHKDGTFAKYEGLDGKNIFVKQGDIVLPNQPLGKLTQYDKTGTYQLRFTVDYLIENPSEKENTIQRFTYAYIDPFFQSTEGVAKLVSQKTYTTKISEDQILKELSKKEIKNRQKK